MKLNKFSGAVAGRIPEIIELMQVRLGHTSDSARPWGD
jgi:hypothetical protein